MSEALNFAQAGRLPAAGDNCAIAIRRLDAGTVVVMPERSFALSHTVLEAHRFVVAPVAAGQMLTSWGQPFGRALRPLAPGDYVCNATMIEALHSRHVGFEIPAEPNFTDYFQPCTLDEKNFLPAEQVPLYASPRTFLGFARNGGRGAGTRNYVVVLGTSSLTGSFARVLASKFKDAPEKFPNLDGVVAVAHTEGGEAGRPNNLELSLRTLAGWVTNPNVGAVLAVDYGHEPINNDALRDWMRANHYPLDAVPHHFFRLGKDFAANVAAGAKLVEELLLQASSTPRTEQPLRHLKIGLQCGGSDAFSGVSGNPVVGIIARETVRHGGSANLAETDELMGAEPYVLAKVRDLATARKFLDTLKEFEEKLSWHGVSGQTNPSGGNIFRGLYNIAIKSIGAARKKDPAVRLDYVIGYGEPMREPGFCFMNSPGNDLESIAGQVAAGCNLILFSTGNGSITNHPFVPTIKLMTNTPRFNLLSRDMDFNAGRYLDGEPMERLGAEAFDYTMRVVSGMKSVGEKAGHSQAQLWREWRQTSVKSLPQFASRPKPAGEPVKLKLAVGGTSYASPTNFLAQLGTRAACPSEAWRTRLIIPTSLCAGQISRMIADKLNATRGDATPRYVALPHTEGCGVSGEAVEILEQTIAGYAAHPLAERVCLVEHGCEKTHNDAIRNFLAAHDMDYSRMGFASIQLDGGIENVTEKVVKWFEQGSAAVPAAVRSVPAADSARESVRRDAEHGTRDACAPRASGKNFRLGLAANGEVPDKIAAALALLTRALVENGGTVVVPQTSPLLATPAFARELFDSPPAPTLAYGGIAAKPGFHVMESAGTHLVEAFTGLGACGVELLLAFVGDAPAQAHPFVPTLQVSVAAVSSEVDLVLDQPDEIATARALVQLLADTLAGKHQPRAQADGNADFQVTRGWLGVST
ncbi:MAG: UxaA family hydrolase [Verrucomicrobia bacterium]|nr:UxaA family hydrolase [Verrucomicrobiota bacterium]